MNQKFFAQYPVELTDLPWEIPDHGMDVWKTIKKPGHFGKRSTLRIV